MEIHSLALLPLLCVTWALLGLSATVAMSVISGHRKLPYISHTGEEFPESVVYTVVFMVTSILGVGLASIRYRFMILRSEPSEKCHIISQRILYAMGWLMYIGTAINGVFSLKSNPTAHRLGAGLAYFIGVIYNLWQAVCLYKRSFSSRGICHIRLALAIVTTAALHIFSGGIIISFLQLCPDRCAEILYLVGMVSEYTTFIGLILHQVMNYTDFQHLTLSLSREGVSISLREKTQDPKNPE